MTNTLETMLALLNLSGGEIILILLVLLVTVTVVVVAIAAALLIFGRKNRPEVATPASQPVKPSPTQATQVFRKCPKCGADLKADLPEGLCPACLLQRGIATEGGASPGSATFTPPPLAELAKLFPQLEILEVIGQGGMGAVYKARQPSLDRFVALKILAPRSGGDLDFSGRFSREARALARLSHPNIVAVYDFGQIQRSANTVPSPETQPLSYFIMEFVDGPNLRQLEQSGKLAPREALQIIPQICGALQFAHDEGIVHRDIKPENVLLDKKGRVKIADFGLAKILGQEADFRLTGARDVMGTPHYMAPEQVEKPQEVDHRADIYSLGVVFYEMLTGELPLGKFDPPSHKVQIDVRLDDVVLRSLANNPDRRYQHVSEIKTEVETISTTSPTPNRAGGMASFAPGWEYKSARTFFGLPLLHVSGGINPATGKANVSRGVFAFGQIAQGIFASGGRAYGVVAFGGIATGIFAFGGIALGGVAFGGLALGLILAIGALSIGFMSIGAPSLSLHRMHDDILAPYVGMAHLQPGQFGALLGLAVSLAFSFVLTHLLVHFWARKRATMNPTPSHPIPPGSGHGLRCLALAFGVFVIMAALLTAFARHQARTQMTASACAQIHYQVFECDAALADQVIPVSERKNGEQPAVARLARLRDDSTPPGYTNGSIKIKTPGVIESEPSVAAVDKRTLEMLVDRVDPQPHLLVDQYKVISSSLGFPGVPESWTYTKTETGEQEPGEGAGYLGLRRNNGRLELRIEYQLRHTFESDRLAPNTRLASHFLFQDRLPQRGALIFLIPFMRQDNSRHYLAVAYQIHEIPQNRVNSVTDSQSTNLEALNTVKAIVHIRRFTAYSPNSPNIEYAATLPSGYALQATARPDGSVLSLPMAAGSDENRVLWNFPAFKPIRPLKPGDFKPGQPLPTIPSPKFDSFEEREAQRKTLVGQLQDLQDQGPIPIVLGQPKLIFTVTNGSGDISQGFLELVHAKTNQPAATVPGLRTKYVWPQGSETNHQLSPEEQILLLEQQRIKYAPVAPAPVPTPTLPLPVPGIVRPQRSLPPTQPSLTPKEQAALIEIQRAKLRAAPGAIPPPLTSPTIDPRSGLPLSSSNAPQK